MKEEKGLTWPQIRYWLVVIALLIVGFAATVWGDIVPAVGQIAKELGPGIFTAGILAGLVEPFFRREFARDAFLAAYRYVLPTEFKDEVEKILRFEFVADYQLWTVQIDKVDDDDDTVLVTTSFEKTIKNRSKIERPARGFYTVNDFSFSNGPSIILECTIEYEGQKITQFNVETKNNNELIATTKGLTIKPGETARIYGKATQYRRANDLVFETFVTPAINPVIAVIMSKEFEHLVEFGTPGKVVKEEFADRYTLPGVYFPGQFMFVRWCRKRKNIPVHRQISQIEVQPRRGLLDCAERDCSGTWREPATTDH